MEPAWVLSAPDGPHVGPIKLAIKVVTFAVAYGLVYLSPIPTKLLVAVGSNVNTESLKGDVRVLRH